MYNTFYIIYPEVFDSNRRSWKSTKMDARKQLKNNMAAQLDQLPFDWLKVDIEYSSPPRAM